jgi:UDPglucose 6-dehydrogenase
MDPRSAELAKYAANAMLAARLSFINEMSALCEAVGADVEMIRRAIGADPRIGAAYLSVGPGFGGSCLPKDLRALAHIATARGVEPLLIDAVMRVNERQRQRLSRRVLALFGPNLSETRTAIWGLSFKAGTNDIRASPALDLIEQLDSAGAQVVAYDPVAMPEVRARGCVAALASDKYEAATGADALLLVTAWPELCEPDFARLRACMRRPVLIDGRNAWDPDAVRALGFTYHGLGR